VSVRVPPEYRYLALEGGWPQFALTGLVTRPDGTLSLAPIPELTVSLSRPFDPVPGLEQAIGVGTDLNGDIYYVDPGDPEQQPPIPPGIVRVNACDDSVEPLPCITFGTDPAQVRMPHALIVGPRRALYIADTGNRRVQIIDL